MKRRGLLLIMVVIVAVLAWPAMTPGLFSGRDVGQAFTMAAEIPRQIVYSPKFRWVRRKVETSSVRAVEIAQFEMFHPQGLAPRIEREVMGLFHAHYHKHPKPEKEYWPFKYGAWMFPIPEPSTWTTMILGFGLVGTVLRAARPRRARS